MQYISSATSPKGVVACRLRTTGLGGQVSLLLHMATPARKLAPDVMAPTTKAGT